MERPRVRLWTCAEPVDASDGVRPRRAGGEPAGRWELIRPVYSLGPESARRGRRVGAFRHFGWTAGVSMPPVADLRQCTPACLISAASASTSAGFMSVSGGRTGPASCPTIFAPAFTMLTA